MLGAAWVAERAMLPALSAAANCRVEAIASRDPARAQRLARIHDIPRVEPDYAGVLDNPRVDAVYVPLVNSLHLPWTLRALRAGKHVLCEKPLGVDAVQAEQMAEAAGSAGLALMEALMYRFHPRIAGLRATAQRVEYLHAAFGFRETDPDDHRLRRELGGGALLDVGVYVSDVARWFLGDPERLCAVAVRGRNGVDLSVAVSCTFPGGQASLWASIDSPEYQELRLVSAASQVSVEKAFTAWRDPHDPYQLMVEAYADAVLEGRPAPLPPEESIANLRLMDRIRQAAGI